MEGYKVFDQNVPNQVWITDDEGGCEPKPGSQVSVASTFVVKIADDFTWTLANTNLADVSEGKSRSGVRNVEFLPVKILLSVKTTKEHAQHEDEDRQGYKYLKKHCKESKTKGLDFNSCHK